MDRLRRTDFWIPLRSLRSLGRIPAISSRPGTTTGPSRFSTVAVPLAVSGPETVCGRASRVLPYPRGFRSPGQGTPVNKRYQTGRSRQRLPQTDSIPWDRHAEGSRRVGPRSPETRIPARPLERTWLSHDGCGVQQPCPGHEPRRSGELIHRLLQAPKDVTTPRNQEAFREALSRPWRHW